MGIGRWIGIGARPAPSTCSYVPSKVTDGSVQSRRSSPICSLMRRPRSPKSLPSASYSTGFQPIADAEAEVALGEQVDLGRLLGDQGGLALREDDDAGDELDLGDRGQVAEHDERLVEGRRDVVGTGPALVHAGIGADHVVVGQEVREAEIADRLAVGPHRADVAPELGLREHHTDLHDASPCRADAQRDDLERAQGTGDPRARDLDGHVGDRRVRLLEEVGDR